MAGPDRRAEHRAAMLEQKGEVGGHRRTERKGQSENHDPDLDAACLPARPSATRARVSEPCTARAYP